MINKIGESVTNLNFEKEFNEYCEQYEKREDFLPLDNKVFSIFIFIKWLETNIDKIKKVITRKEYRAAIEFLYYLYISEKDKEAAKLINVLYANDNILRKEPRPNGNKVKSTDEKALIKLIKIISTPKYFKKTEYDIIEFFTYSIFIHLPDKYLKVFEFSDNQILKVNDTIAWAWADMKTFEIKKKLKELFNFNNPLINDESYQSITNSITNKKKVRKFTTKNNRIILLSDLNKLFEKQLTFWGILISKSALKHIPNKKYPNEMHEYTKQMIDSGYQATKVYEMALGKFNKDPLKYESYEKCFRAWKKGGSNY